MLDYDVIVLGGGSAGSAAAAAAHEAGARTAMINDGELGGLCILRGCMPTKSMLAAAHAIHEAERLAPFGARLEGRVAADFARIMQRKDGHVARFKKAKVDGIAAAGYEVIDARGRFVAGGGVEVDGRVLQARSYVIATGSRSWNLPIPGIEDVPVWDSDSVMGLQEQPERLLVQGAGPIGLELGQFFARIGTHVSLVNRSPLLSRFDTDAGAELTAALEAEPRFDLLVPGTIRQLAPRGRGLVASVEHGDRLREVEADALLMAIGREAALDDLGLEHVGLTPANGGLSHDDGMRTANPAIYVVGDATGTEQILHIANQEGAAAGANAAAGEIVERVDRRLRMSMIFTDPPYAEVGETEAAARKRGLEPVVGKARFAETGRAITMETEYGVWKLVVDPRDRKILGTTILGPRADDLAHIVTVMMHHDATVDEIFELPWYHPTLSEVMLNLGRSARRQLSSISVS